MINIARFWAKILVFLLGLCLWPCCALFWLCFWAPSTFIATAIINLIHFARNDDDYEDFNLVWWGFWVLVMWDEKKANKYI